MLAALNLAKVEFDIAKAIALVTADSKDVQEGNYRIVLYLGLSMNSGFFLCKRFRL